MPENNQANGRPGFSLKRELQRKSIHLGMIIIPLWVYITPPNWSLLGLIIATFATVAVDLLRLTDQRLRGFFLRLFRSLIRSHEQEHLLGSTYFMIAALLSVLAFDHNIAIASLTFLILGDTVAAIVGKKYGRPMYWGKSPQGSMACFVCCLIIGAALLDNRWVIVAGALAATLAEALPVPMDDNMRVPVVSGLVMQLVANYLQG
ncbi:MAG: SEC59/DGK1/VTE5 family protein [Candidatus Latescibacterota bacterium]|jgi:dolichol kinase